MPTPRATAPVSDTPPTLLMFSFTGATPAAYHVTRVAWTADAYAIIASLHQAVRQQQRQLPIRDLRLRVQVYDTGALRVSYNLGIGYEDAEGAALDILYSYSSAPEAREQANRAVADWVAETVTNADDLSRVDIKSAQRLRRLAIEGNAVEARTDEVPVFQWDSNPDTGSAWPRKNARTGHRVANGFVDLADYVALQLAGQTVFPNASVLRREIGADLQAGSARLLTDPIPVALGAKNRCWLSLGLTVTAATYPGRSLPVIKVEVRKLVWTSAPKKSYLGRNLSGFALPQGEQRAFKFEIGSRTLAIGPEYRAIAREYIDLPVRDDLTAEDLARDGLGYTSCPVVVSAMPGRSSVKVVGRGVTDLDRQLAFEHLTQLLAPHGFTPMGTALHRVKTPTKSLAGLAADWKGPLRAGGVPADKETAAHLKWARDMHAGIGQYYGGTHRVLLAYQDGLHEDAKRVELILHRVLGAQAICFHYAMLPPEVHGSKWAMGVDKPLPPAQRAEQRLAVWQPWLKEVKRECAAAGCLPLHGVLVLARKKYAEGPDDPINKQVGRVALIQGLGGAVVQYLLPSVSKLGAEPTPADLQDFQMRVMNAWRDMSLKSVGRMHSLPERLTASMPTVQQTGVLPVLLGIGIMRVNKMRAKGNNTSFIPYCVELDPLTGECRATMQLRKLGASTSPHTLPMQPLTDAVRALAAHGPSYLVEKSNPQLVLRERQRITEEFLHDVLLERSAHHQGREIVLLADSSTLGGIWTWLADDKITPTDLRLHNRSRLQLALPNVTLVRVRPSHAPKALLPTPYVQVAVSQPDGSYGAPRLSARWCDAKLYHLQGTSPQLPTYLSYGSRLFKPARGVSSYQATTSHKRGEQKSHTPYTDPWATPNAVEITVVQDPGQPPRFVADELAALVEALRSTYDHFGGWTTMPGPLHFASFLKEYIPDYDFAEAEAEDKADKDDKDD